MLGNQCLNQQVMNLERSIRALEAHLRFLEEQVQVKRTLGRRADSWWRGFWQGGRETSSVISSARPIRPNRKKDAQLLSNCMNERAVQT
jgi:hypothetical protein